MNEKTISKPVIAEIAKASRSIVPWTPLGGGGAYYRAQYEPQVAIANLLTHTGLWPRAIKLNPS